MLICFGKSLYFDGKYDLPWVNMVYFFVNEYVDGIYCWFNDWGFGCWKVLWISGKMAGDLLLVEVVRKFVGK